MKIRCYSCNKRPRQRDGLCLPCKREYMAAWRAKNRRRINASKKQWRDNNKKAVIAYHKNWRSNNKEKVVSYTRKWKSKNKERVRIHNIKYRYGVDHSVIKLTLKAQDNKCAACRIKLTRSSARIDHCHKSSKFRGILCHNCNVALGLMRDNPESIRNLAKYAAKHRKR